MPKANPRPPESKTQTSLRRPCHVGVAVLKVSSGARDSPVSLRSLATVPAFRTYFQGSYHGPSGVPVHCESTG